MMLNTQAYIVSKLHATIFLARGQAYSLHGHYRSFVIWRLIC